MPSTGTAPAKAFTKAEVVRIGDHGGESWLEKQIKLNPGLLGLEGARVVSTQIIHKGAGRLDLLAKDEEGQVTYAVEIMLGQLDESHIVRALDYWLKEKARPSPDDWETVAVVAAEDVRGSRFYGVARFLSEKMPLIVIEMKALKVGNRLTLVSTPLLDGTNSIDAPSLDVVETEPMNEETWAGRSSRASSDIVSKCGDLLKKINHELSLNWTNQEFVGIGFKNRPRNFVVFKPKQKWVRVHARFLPDSEKWRKKLTSAGLHVVGGKPGRSIHFRMTSPDLKANTKLIKDLFAECYRNRIGKKD